MTDFHSAEPPTPAGPHSSTLAMDQALDWLIELEHPNEEQVRQFHPVSYTHLTLPTKRIV